MKTSDPIISFIYEFLPGALWLSQKGYSAIAVLSHAGLESGWGRSRLAREFKNYFGIKGRDVKLQTKEFENGRYVVKEDGFASFRSIIDCCVTYDFIIQRYHTKAFEVRHDPESYFKALQESGYATDPLYSGKLILVMNSILRRLEVV